MAGDLLLFFAGFLLVCLNGFFFSFFFVQGTDDDPVRASIDLDDRVASDGSETGQEFRGVLPEVEMALQHDTSTRMESLNDHAADAGFAALFFLLGLLFPPISWKGLWA